MTKLQFETAAEVDRLCQQIEKDVHKTFRRFGAVVGTSGGVDSAVVLALCARALGPENVTALFLPERESSPQSLQLAQGWADKLGVPWMIEDITAALEGAGCYERRDEAIRRIFPEYGDGWSSKITLPGSLLDDDTLNIFYLTVVSPSGEEKRERLLSENFRQVMAASNFKQRTRMAMLYYHAERQNYAVVGTGNRNEHLLGFFVKYGDGASDLAPILHLLKSEVYQLAEYLNVPQSIAGRTPTSDTYSAGSSQEEFFFRLPFDILDPIWRLWQMGLEIDAIADELDLTTQQVQRIVNDLIRKHKTTAYLRSPVVTYSSQRETIRSLPENNDDRQIVQEN